MKYVDIDKRLQLQILDQVRSNTGLGQQAIEKDWWVTQVLRALFALPYAKHLSFKGGTSLSKCWGLIERFSEDIDIGIDRTFLGFEGELSKTQINDRLRRATCSFVREKMQHDVRTQIIANGIKAELFEVSVNITPITTTDPEIIMINYQSALPLSEYIAHTVKVEIGGRSMHEPVEMHEIRSMIDEAFPQAPFTETGLQVQAVIPQRTFLEKLFLLHEEFAKPQSEIRTERMSRHMYDIERMMKTCIAEKALQDEALYRAVIEHRRKFIGLRGFDYDTLYPATLNLLPPNKEIEKLWREDYRRMQDTMIYGKSVSFDELLKILQLLNKRIRIHNTQSDLTAYSSVYPET